MKTIIVIFGNPSVVTSANTRKYCFRTDSDVKPGDKLRTPQYDSDITVMDVLDEDYKYYHQDTGEMSNKITSTRQWPIKTIKVVDKSTDAILASIVG